MRPVKIASAIAACIAATVIAGDGRLFPLKRASVEFDNPAPGGEFKFREAKLSVEFRPRAAGEFVTDFERAGLASLVIELGKERLSVPDAVLRDFTNMNLSKLVFTAFAGRYYLSFWAGYGSNYGEVRFFWRNGKLDDVEVEMPIRSSIKSRYPEIFGKK
jgi:hypothetical protein